LRISTLLSRGLTEEQLKQLEKEIKGSVLAKQLRTFLREEIERSYKAEESLEHDSLPLYLKEVGARRGHRQVLHLILDEESK
jgi:hypothetical protein